MINFPSQGELNELKAFDEPYCLSIYAPFIDPNAATNPNLIELKNILREAETALLSTGTKPKDVKKTLRPARLLLEDHEFWPLHHESLVLFMHPKLFRYYHIPNHSAPYILTVEKGFNLKPLEKVMNENRSYFVLALSHKNVHLYEGDHYQLKPVRLKNFPTDMKEALNIDEYPHSRQLHVVAPVSEGKGSEGYHEQYDVSKTDKAMLLQFFRLIDKRLHSFLQKKQLPLIVGGVGYLLPVYRQANTSKYLLPDIIKGNIEHTNLDVIRQRAWSLISRSGSP